MTNQENTLIQALSYCSLRDLPDKYNGEYVWLKALVLVTTVNCEKEYAYAVKGEKGTIRIVKTFGNSAIHKIEEIYPFAMLEEAYMPTFKSRSKEERLNWLERYNTEANEGMTLKQLDSMVLDQAIKNNLTALRNG